MCDGVSDFYFSRRLHVGDDIANVSSLKLFGLRHLGCEVSNFFDLVVSGSMKELDFVTFLHLTGDNANVGDDTSVGIVKRVEDRGTKKAVWVFYGWWNELHNSLENVLNTDPLFGGSRDGVVARNGEDFFKLSPASIDIGSRKVDLVENWHNSEILFHGEIYVGHGLGFDTLCGINDEDGPLAGGE